MTSSMEDRSLSAEEIRREKRRQKILLNSSDRIRKIVTGYPDEPCINDEARELPGETLSSSSSSEVYASQEVDHMHTEETQDVLHTDSVKDDTEYQPRDLLTAENNKQQKLNGQHDLFATVRTLLVLFCGILVRLSFLFSFGEQYVQTIFNPFMTMEIAIIGYQKAMNMDLGADIKGGIWLSMLVLAGIKPEIITSYKTVMGIASAVGTDFTLYLFGIIITHIVL